MLFFSFFTIKMISTQYIHMHKEGFLASSAKKKQSKVLIERLFTYLPSDDVSWEDSVTKACVEGINK